MIAVHFGAGNIGRGFIGLLLHEANYDLVFLDVNAELVDLLNSHPTYKVTETGEGAKNHTVTNYRAINTQTNFDEAANVIAQAEVLTTSVGVNVLKFLAPVIVAGLNLRTNQKPLLVMACENAIGATDLLKTEIEKLDTEAAKSAIFANTAVDRIVPHQITQDLDVEVEAFSEWVVELKGDKPNIPGAHFVENLTPYIERKLFTVNTGHATLAYCGQLAGATTIVEASENHSVLKTVTKVLDETSQVLINRHNFDPSEHATYVAQTLARFTNPDLDDPLERVGRQPARKLSRHDRLVGPAAYLAEMGIEPTGLLVAIDAALQFKDASDDSVEELHQQLKTMNTKDFVSEVMGIEPTHPLAAKLTSHVDDVKRK